jgi:thiamine monophosphate synthase
MLQTEGASRVVSLTKEVKLLGNSDKLRLTLENTRTLSQAVSIPVMTASGIDAANVQKAFLAGASAVGVGKAVNQFHREEDMIETLVELMTQVSAFAEHPPIVALAS